MLELLLSYVYYTSLSIQKLIDVIHGMRVLAARIAPAILVTAAVSLRIVFCAFPAAVIMIAIDIHLFHYLGTRAAAITPARRISPFGTGTALKDIA